MPHKTRLAHTEAKKDNTIEGRYGFRHYKCSFHAHANVSTDTNNKMKAKYNLFVITLAANAPVRLTFCIYVLTRVAFTSDSS